MSAVMFTSCGIQWLAQPSRYFCQAQSYLKGTSWLRSARQLIMRFRSTVTRWYSSCPLVPAMGDVEVRERLLRLLRARRSAWLRASPRPAPATVIGAAVNVSATGEGGGTATGFARGCSGGGCTADASVATGSGSGARAAAGLAAGFGASSS
jgi:hypothetical protein